MLYKFRQPALLRFASDSFMDDFNATLQTAPLRVTALRAQPETWKGPVPAPILPTKTLQRAVELRKASGIFTPKRALEITQKLASESQLPQAPPPFDLKLYQPAHQRYYLVAGCFVCRTPGLPDRTLNPGAGERVSFVIRRLHATSENTTVNPLDPTTFSEYAFVAQGGANGWQKTNDAQTAAPDEERQPLFPMTYDEMDGRKRRLLAGLVPVARRETYVHAAELQANGVLAPNSNPFQPSDPRAVQLAAQVIEPWKELITRAERTWAALNPGADPIAKPTTGEPAKALLGNTRNDIQHISWLLILDLDKWLQTHTKTLWQAIQHNATGTLHGANLTAFQALHTFKASAAILTEIAASAQTAIALDKALRDIGAFEARLEKAAQPYAGILGHAPPDERIPFPTFRFPLADPKMTATAAGFQAARDAVDALMPKLTSLLQTPMTALPPLALAAQPVMAPNEKVWFVIRMVWECPKCGALKPPIVSEPTEPFQMASYYDPDAPARPIRIAMPLDTSPAGLRKFDKNAIFMLSDMLCGQVSKARGMGLGDLVRSVLPFPLHKDLDTSTPECDKDGITVGMMCSLSIPIITICAFLLLMIMVTLFDLIFRWMPFFILCFPVPNFKGKAAVNLGT